MRPALSRMLCPGCYAYDDAHLAGGMTLRSLHDRKGQELIDGVLETVDRICKMFSGVTAPRRLHYTGEIFWWLVAKIGNLI